MGQNQSHGFRQSIEDSGFNGTGWKLCGKNFRETAVVEADDEGSDRKRLGEQQIAVSEND